VTQTTQAGGDLDDIDSYLYRRSQAAADRVRDGINTTARRLAASPGLGRPRPELGPGIRSFPTSDGYIIYYLPTGGGIEVQRVIHGSRNVDSTMFDV